MMTDDETLAGQAADGDREAFCALLSRHYDRLFGLSLRLMGNRAEAEDLTQDICAALPAKLRGFRNQARFTTWLYRVTVNAAHDRRRRHASHARAAAGWGDWEVGRRAADRQARQELDWLSEAMAALPAELRDTLALTLDADMTHREAAAVLGLSEGTISWRMSQVKDRLRALHERDETP